MKEYKVLNRVMQEENERYKDQSIKTQKEIRKMKKKNKRISHTTLGWIKKYKFQVSKIKVLKNKIRIFKEKVTPAGTRLNILADAISLC